MGQPDFVSTLPNNRTTDYAFGDTLDGMTYDRGRIIVADPNNRRVLIVPAK
jgi:hypothetical protein